MALIESVSKDITVLVVDDQVLTRNLVKAILRNQGFKSIIQAENGLLAINMLNKEEIGLVVCDWNMPGATGLDVLKATRAVSGNKVPFVMLTAEAYRKNIDEATEAGVTAYVLKPFTPEVLCEKIAIALSQTPNEGE